ncbi:MAG: hypothetical protein RSD67_07265 [Oscillospiraceae bacterium]
MSDILPVGQSVNPKSNINHGSIKPEQHNQQTQNNFNIVDLAKVLKPNNHDDYSDNSFLENQRQMLTERFFFNLISDPGLAAGALKTIFNSYLVLALSGDSNVGSLDEMNSLAQALSLDYSQMLGELFTQSEGISMFKGQLFDILRLLYSNSKDADLKDSIVKLLKGISTRMSSNDVLNSLKSNISTLMNILPPKSAHFQNLSNILDVLNSISKNNSDDEYNTAKNNIKQEINQPQTNKTELNQAETSKIAANQLSDKTPNLTQQIRNEANEEWLEKKFEELFAQMSIPNSKINNEQIKELIRNLNIKNPDWLHSFDIIKTSITQAIQKLQASPFNTAETENFSALILYNLSYLNSSPTDLNDLFLNVLVKLGNNKELAATLSAGYRELEDNAFIGNEKKSDLINAISKFVDNFFQQSKTNTIANTEINNILRSLIAAPNSFTPLLHFMLPMRYETAQGFGELWVDPYEIAKDKKGEVSKERAVHIFFIADILDIGYFEVEIYLFNQKVNVNLFCPPDYYDSFKSVKERLAKTIASTTTYKFEGFSIEPLKRKRSLPQVFKKLAEKRDGFNVSI